MRVGVEALFGFRKAAVRRRDVPVEKPKMTEEIAQQLRGEAEFGSMFLPENIKVQIAKRDKKNKNG